MTCTWCSTKEIHVVIKHNIIDTSGCVLIPKSWHFHFAPWWHFNITIFRIFLADDRTLHVFIKTSDVPYAMDMSHIALFVSFETICIYLQVWTKERKCLNLSLYLSFIRFTIYLYQFFIYHLLSMILMKVYIFTMTLHMPTKERRCTKFISRRH